MNYMLHGDRRYAKRLHRQLKNLCVRRNRFLRLAHKARRALAVATAELAQRNDP